MQKNSYEFYKIFLNPLILFQKLNLSITNEY